VVHHFVGKERPGRQLASTGTDVEGLVPAGLLMVFAGGIATVAARSKKASEG
jgi:hypothetical protein